VYRLRFRNLESGRDLPDVIGRSYYTGAWSADSRSFFYLVPDSVFRSYLVRRHLLGSDPTEDDDVFREDDRAFEVEVRGTRSGAYIVIRTANRDTAECHLIPADHPWHAPAVVWPRRREVDYDVEHVAAPDSGSGPGRLLAVTNDEAAEYRLLAADLATGPDGERRPGEWRELVGHRDDVRLVRADGFAGHLVLSARRGGRTLLEIRGHDGALRHELAGRLEQGTLDLATNEEYDAVAVTVRTASLIEPASWWDVDLTSGEWSLRHRDDVPAYDAGDHVTERLARAPDGTSVRDRGPAPVHPVDGTAPCLLYGYGAYEASSDPDFEVPVTALLDAGACTRSRTSAAAARTAAGGGSAGGCTRSRTASPTSWPPARR
jgi:oligopeptidase B